MNTARPERQRPYGTCKNDRLPKWSFDVNIATAGPAGARRDGIPGNPTAQSARTMHPISFAAFTLFTLWDFYIPSAGGKVTDYVGLMVLALSLIPRLAMGDWRPLGLTGTHFLFLLTALPLIALGAVRGSLLTAAAYFIGCAFVFGVFFQKDYDFRLLYRQMGWL